VIEPPFRRPLFDNLDPIGVTPHTARPTLFRGVTTQAPATETEEANDRKIVSELRYEHGQKVEHRPS